MNLFGADPTAKLGISITQTVFLAVGAWCSRWGP